MATPFSATPIIPMGTQLGEAAIVGFSGNEKEMFCFWMLFGLVSI